MGPAPGRAVVAGGHLAAASGLPTDYHCTPSVCRPGPFPPSTRRRPRTVLTLETSIWQARIGIVFVALGLRLRRLHQDSGAPSGRHRPRAKSGPSGRCDIRSGRGGIPGTASPLHESRHAAVLRTEVLTLHEFLMPGPGQISWCAAPGDVRSGVRSDRDTISGADRRKGCRTTPTGITSPPTHFGDLQDSCAWRGSPQATHRVPKVFVEAGESKPVTITVDPAASNHPFSLWDHCSRAFVIKPGRYTVYVGNSAGQHPGRGGPHRWMRPLDSEFGTVRPADHILHAPRDRRGR